MTPQSFPSNIRSFLLFGVIVFLVYSNAVDAPWHFDDFENITNNRQVHITDLSPASLSAFIHDIWCQGWLKRPLAYTSLAVNWYFGANQPAGYHLVNVFIHLAAAFFLFLSSVRLFQTPRMSGKYTPQQIHFVSVLAALLWAVNPIQTQAVTYVIQRMASMSGMFFILSVWFYLTGRLTAAWSAKAFMFFACAVSMVAAFLSKENAATLPFSLLLIEAVFFQDLRSKKKMWAVLSILLAVALFSLTLSGFLFFGGNPLGVLNYGDRFFTAWERLLTQPRALVFYISLILYPSPTRLSVTHDFAASTSLLSPWTTGLSLITIMCLVAAAIWRIRRWPLVSFAILFFFVNHLVESTIIGLELVFEHRNYLPSMFMFLPVAAGMSRGLDHFRHRSTVVYCALWVFIPLLIVGLGSGTYIRNRTWADPLTLWEDAMVKAPGESRPYQMLAVHHYERIGDRDMALSLYRKALSLRKTRISDDAVIYSNMAAIYFQRKDFARAAELWGQAADAYPAYQFTSYHLAEALVKIGRLDEAIQRLDQILQKRPYHLGPLSLKGMILVRQNKILEGLASLKQSIKPEAISRALMINLGAAFHFLGNDSKASIFLYEAQRMAPNDRAVLLWLAKHHLRAGSPDMADSYLARLVAAGPLNGLTAWLSSIGTAEFPEDDVIAPELDGMLAARLNQAYQQAAAGFRFPPSAEN
jgi:tetratricopeptide (TPR) repeat protein